MKNRFLIFFLLLVTAVYADTPVDPPADADLPEASIEQNVFLLFMMALLLSFVSIVKYKNKKKYPF